MAPFSRVAFHPANALTSRGTYRIVGIATDVSVDALLYDIPKYRPSVPRSMDGDMSTHAGVEFLVGVL